MELILILLCLFAACADGQSLIGEAGGIFSTTAKPSSVDLTTGLMGYWKMDETGTVAHDSSGNNNSLYATNAVWGSPGHKGSFLSGQPYYSVTNTVPPLVGLPVWNTTTGYSVSAWVQVLTNSSSGEVYMENTSGSYPYWALGWSAGQLMLYSDSGNTLHFGSLTADGLWHHVAATVTSTGTGTAYVDNVVAGSTTVTAGTGINTVGIGDTQITGSVGVNIDEVRVYKLVLTTQQIAALYAL